jgi:ergothioneine biosynthesis protein EgtB
VSETSTGRWADIAGLFELGLNHEQQHQELMLADIKHVFSVNPLRPVYRDDAAAPPRGAAPGLRWFGHEGGVATIGHDGNGFGFDNEFPRHKAWLENFEIASRPVANGEFLDFIADGGYGEARHWLSDGWTTVQRDGWRAPLYWREKDGAWFDFTMGGERPLDRDAPACHLSFYEADAYARWAGARLPTEAEWETAARSAALAEADANLLTAGHLHPVPANDNGGDGPVQLLGDVWEWTRTSYAPYPGFRPAAGAVGEYNGKFMANQMTLRGGSCFTPPDHVRTTYRNFFYPDQRWQVMGVRLARDA